MRLNFFFKHLFKLKRVHIELINRQKKINKLKNNNYWFSKWFY